MTRRLKVPGLALQPTACRSFGVEPLHGVTDAQAVSGDVTVDAKVHNLHVKTVEWDT